MAQVRFGTIGTSGICEQFLAALEDVEGARFSACYSRSIEKAREFGAAHGATLFFDDVEAMCACDEVDAVYIASPNALHAPQALAAIAAGKHVLVEKPLASNEREALEVIEAARAAGVVCLEALRSLYVPTFGAIKEEVGRIGEPRLAQIGFSKVTSRMARFRAGERLNIFDPKLSEGALMDIGVYAVAPAVALFGRPDEVRALGVTAPVPGSAPGDEFGVIDLCGVVTLGYPGLVASLNYGKVSDDQVSCQVQGEQGTVVWDACSCPENVRVFEHEDKGLVFRVEKPRSRVRPETPPERDMACEIAAFVAAATGEPDALERIRKMNTVSLDTAYVMDEARRQLGVRFPADLR